MDRLRIVEASKTGERIPYPPFYEEVRAGGSRVVPDAAPMTVMPFIDVAVFNREPSLRTVFHTLVHVAQYSAVGANAMMRGYFEALNEVGLWMVVPFEEQAYQLDARYTRDPADGFSVEDELSEWVRSGKFNLGEQSLGERRCTRKRVSLAEAAQREAADCSRRMVMALGGAW